MKILLCSLLVMAVPIQVAAAQSAGPGASSLDVLRAPVPVTDADLARAEREVQRPHPLADSLANRFGVKNGGVELLNGNDFNIESKAHFAASIDARGAALSVRW
jgi:hypothetical protein